MDYEGVSNLVLLGMCMAGDIPEDYQTVLSVLQVREDYEMARIMGLDHEQAFNIAMVCAEPTSEYLH